jgi:hypothetical protein
VTEGQPAARNWARGARGEGSTIELVDAECWGDGQRHCGGRQRQQACLACLAGLLSLLPKHGEFGKVPGARKPAGKGAIISFAYGNVKLHNAAIRPVGRGDGELTAFGTLGLSSHNEPPWAIVGTIARPLNGWPVYKVVTPTDQFESCFPNLSFHP